MRGEGFRDVATIAITFINLNKKTAFRKNLFILCGNSGNKVEVLYMGDRINKKSRPLNPISKCNNEAYEVINATS